MYITPCNTATLQNSKFANLVVEIPVFSLGALSSGSHGYVTKTVTVPTGYAAKMAVAEIQRLGIVSGNLALSCTTDASGTVYISYYSYATISADNSGITVKVLCVPS